MDDQLPLNNKSTETPGILIEPFQPEDQQAVKTLILDGLVEHWGWLDPYKNPDLNDIASSYVDSVFLVARQSGQVIGTGALVHRSESTAEIVRMSVAASHRRQGIGRLILERLVNHAHRIGMKQIILETTAAWEEVVEFYQNAGFELSHYTDGDAFFFMDIEAQANSMGIQSQEE